MTKDQANELKVGIVVLLCIVLGLTVILQLSNWEQWFERTDRITFKLPYRAGLGGIQAGWPVTLGGVAIGNVEKVWVARQSHDSRDTSQEKTEIDQSGQSQPDTPEFTEPAGQESTSTVYAFFTVTMPGKYQLRDDCKLVPDSQLIGGAGQLVIADVGQEGQLLQDQQEVFLEGLDGTSMASLMDRMATLMDQAGQALVEIESITADFVDVSANAREIVIKAKPRIEKIIANTQATSGEMKEGMREIRWNPWRLLHNPTDRELRTQNLLTAARAFSSGASDLDASAVRLQGLLDAYGDDLTIDNPELIDIIRGLRASIDKFNQAEKDFFKRLSKGK